eukprot:6209884-Pleurochrysis_carterae.AAC.2
MAPGGGGGAVRQRARRAHSLTAHALPAHAITSGLRGGSGRPLTELQSPLICAMLALAGVGLLCPE